MGAMSALFSPYRLGSLQLANRIVIAPMCQYSAENGEAGDGPWCIWGSWRCRVPTPR